MGLFSGIGKFIGGGLKKIGGIAKHIPGVGGLIGGAAEKIGGLISPGLAVLSGVQGVKASREQQRLLQEALARYNQGYDQGRGLLMQEPRVSLDHLFNTKAPPTGGIQAGLTRVPR